jgi:hypothetical protein
MFAGFSSTARFATSFAKAIKAAFLATKSVSQFSSIKTPRVPSSVVRAITNLRLIRDPDGLLQLLRLFYAGNQ